MGLIEIWELASQIIAVSAVIASATPTPKDDKFIGKVYKWFVEIPAFNFGRAKDSG